MLDFILIYFTNVILLDKANMMCFKWFVHFFFFYIVNYLKYIISAGMT